VVTCTPGLAEMVQRDWARAARFYAKFGITESQFRHGVPSLELVEEASQTTEVSEAAADDRTDARRRAE